MLSLRWLDSPVIYLLPCGHLRTLLFVLKALYLLSELVSIGVWFTVFVGVTRRMTRMKMMIIAIIIIIIITVIIFIMIIMIIIVIAILLLIIIRMIMMISTTKIITIPRIMAYIDIWRKCFEDKSNINIDDNHENNNINQYVIDNSQFHTKVNKKRYWTNKH